MPRKTPKPRKTRRAMTRAMENRPAGRPDLNPPAQSLRQNPGRDHRFERRPPKFPGRLGGR
ncbi:MAG: hypothetical protein AAFU41_09290 [Pseudomonadota bacterium]